jgi:hypothetical protein
VSGFGRNDDFFVSAPGFSYERMRVTVLLKT